MKKLLLKRQWDIEDKIKCLDDEVSRLLDEMYKDPDTAQSRIYKASGDNEKGIEAAIEILKNKAEFFGKRHVNYLSIKAVDEGKKFRENSKILTKALRDIAYEQGRLRHVKSGLKEIDRSEKQDKVKDQLPPPPNSPKRAKKQPEFMIEREAEREAIKAQMQKERAERKVNRATITPQKAHETRAAYEGQKQKRGFVEQQTEKEPRNTPEQFARQVKKEERLADERAAAEKGKPNQAEPDIDRSEDQKAKIREELKKARERHELERDDYDLER